MSSDEERLYDPITAEEGDDEITQNIDASSTSSTPPLSNNEDNHSNVSSPPLLPTTSEVKHRWFILEPPVFLVFFAMYLSSKIHAQILTNKNRT